VIVTVFSIVWENYLKVEKKRIVTEIVIVAAETTMMFVAKETDEIATVFSIA